MFGFKKIKMAQSRKGISYTVWILYLDYMYLLDFYPTLNNYNSKNKNSTSKNQCARGFIEK